MAGERRGSACLYDCTSMYRRRMIDDNHIISLISLFFPLFSLVEKQPGSSEGHPGYTVDAVV